MEAVRIAIDAMGGDDGCAMVVDACVMALQEEENIVLTLFGDEAIIKAKLAKKTYDSSKIEIVHAPEVIENEESPVLAIRRKKESSIVKGLRYVKEGHAKAFVSAGSTGAVLAGGTLIIGRIKGIERPALGSLIPTAKGVSLIMDSGANMDSKPAYLHQYAQMGSVYYEALLGVKSPKIALINVGTEDGKGDHLTKETFNLLKNDSKLNFMGNIEGRDIADGMAHVLIADGFVGNVVLKHTEGFALMLLKKIKEVMTATWYTKLGALLIKGALKRMLKTFDYTEYGGAPLLGLEGLVVKSHGSSKPKAFKNAILQCKTFSDQHVNEKIKQQLL